MAHKKNPVRSKKEVAVVIPIYQTTLTDGERLALAQCHKILGNYPMIAVKPENLAVDELMDDYPKTKVLGLEPAFFRNIEGYNRLMTSPDFYALFQEYKFILIHQLDAYVFRDELRKWCAKDYDYIGAPAFNSTKADSLPEERKDLYQRALSANRLVFNGGFSLRKVSSMMRYLRLHDFFYPTWKGNEDKLFSLDSRRLTPLMPFIRLPQWKEALHFSFERSPAASYGITGSVLPFGCHAWERYDPAFWTKFIVAENQAPHH